MSGAPSASKPDVPSTPKASIIPNRSPSGPTIPKKRNEAGKGDDDDAEARVLGKKRSSCWNNMKSCFKFVLPRSFQPNPIQSAAGLSMRRRKRHLPDRTPSSDAYARWNHLARLGCQWRCMNSGSQAVTKENNSWTFWWTNLIWTRLVLGIQKWTFSFQTNEGARFGSQKCYLNLCLGMHFWGAHGSFRISSRPMSKKHSWRKRRKNNKSFPDGLMRNKWSPSWNGQRLLSASVLNCFFSVFRCLWA